MFCHNLEEGSVPLLATSSITKDSFEMELFLNSSENVVNMSKIDRKVDHRKKIEDNTETESETSSTANSNVEAPSIDNGTDTSIMEVIDRRVSLRVSIANDFSLQNYDESKSSQVESEKLNARLEQGLASNIIGRNEPIETPFGTRAQCYADYTASGKAIQSIETFIRHQVMPTYGNTHTLTSITGLQTTAFREEAREIIGKAVNARLYGTKAQDIVIFSGPNGTSAMTKLLTALGLQTMRRHRRPYKRPVIFTCPFSHPSNLLLWRKVHAVDVVNVPEAKTGAGFDLNGLEALLKRYQSRKLKIGTFAAASSLTGRLIDVDKVSKLLHKYKALAVWDYTTCAPYVEIDMNPTDSEAYKDAVFFSGHKFVGGIGSPGVLIVKETLMKNKVPTMPGGGTVAFVTEKTQCYVANNVEREEGGTPDILGSIRLGLAFELKQRIGTRRIMYLERQHVDRVREVLSKNDYILLLGHEKKRKALDQLPVFSFLIRFGERFLHHNFVCALLNDLFGIQTRGGGRPFDTRLLGLCREQIAALSDAIATDEVLRPGVSRLSFPYFVTSDEIDYILKAVHFVAEHGWKLLPQYEFNVHTGRWRHVSCATAPFSAKKGLKSMQLEEKNSMDRFVRALPIDSVSTHRCSNLEQAPGLADESIEQALSREPCPEAQKVAGRHEWLRWFVYPHEVVAAYKEEGKKPNIREKTEGPCQRQRYLDGAVHNEGDVASSSETTKQRLIRCFKLKVR